MPLEKVSHLSKQVLDTGLKGLEGTLQPFEQQCTNQAYDELLIFGGLLVGVPMVGGRIVDRQRKERVFLIECLLDLTVEGLVDALQRVVDDLWFLPFREQGRVLVFALGVVDRRGRQHEELLAGGQIHEQLTTVGPWVAEMVRLVDDDHVHMVAIQFQCLGVNQPGRVKLGLPTMAKSTGLVS
jgi:hypothetical protein